MSAALRPPQAPAATAGADAVPQIGKKLAIRACARQRQAPLHGVVPGDVLHAMHMRVVGRGHRHVGQREQLRIERFHTERLGLRACMRVLDRGEPCVTIAQHARGILQWRRDHHRETAADAIVGRTHHADPCHARAYARRQYEAPCRTAAIRVLPGIAQCELAFVHRTLEMLIPGVDERRRQAPLDEIARAWKFAKESRRPCRHA